MKKALIIAGIVAAALLSSLLALLLFIQLNKPKAPEAIEGTLSVTVPSSTINLPITYRVEQLADYLNNKITGTFLQKHVYLNSGKEEVYLALTKKDKITVSSTGEKLVCTVPLLVDGRVVNSSLGKTLSRLFKPVQTSLLITLSTPIALDGAWNLSTRFNVKGYKWLTEPVLHIGPFRLHIKEHLDKEIQQRSSELTRMLDEEINKEVSLRPTVSGVWNDLQKPILINSKPPFVWLKFACDDVQGTIELDPETITCLTSLVAKPSIVTDTTSTAKVSSLPAFKILKTKKRSGQSDIYLYAYTSFETLNKELNKYFRDKTFSNNGSSIVIKNINAYASVRGLCIEITTGNSIEGSLFVTGHPVFDPSDQKLRIRNFDFTLQSKNIFQQAGEEILHQSIKNAVASRLHLNLDALIKRIPALAHQAISKGKAGKTISLTLNEPTIESCDIRMGAEKIHLVAHVLTEAQLHLKRIKTGRIIDITDE